MVSSNGTLYENNIAPGLYLYVFTTVTSMSKMMSFQGTCMVALPLHIMTCQCLHLAQT